MLMDDKNTFPVEYGNTGSIMIQTVRFRKNGFLSGKICYKSHCQYCFQLISYGTILVAAYVIYVFLNENFHGSKE